MDGNAPGGVSVASSSSDFVSTLFETPWDSLNIIILTTGCEIRSGSYISTSISVLGGLSLSLCKSLADSMPLRMLEDPAYDQIVRWGDGGDSFVVLEVRVSNTQTVISTNWQTLTGIHRMKNSQRLFCQNILSTAILQASFGS
jgi:hypothetical protein